MNIEQRAKAFVEKELDFAEEGSDLIAYQFGRFAQSELANHDKALRDLVEAAINDEPELPGEIEPEMWTALKNICLVGDKAAATEAFRITVRLTKKGILDRFNALEAARSVSGGE